MEAAEYLKRPYGRLVIPDSDGTFAAEIFEFPGCIAVGKTAAEALANLEEVAIDWINAAIEQGQDIPEPTESVDYSGRLVLRLSKSLHKRAAQCADREGVSLNTFIANGLAEQVGLRSRVQVIGQSQLSGAMTLAIENKLTLTFPLPDAQQKLLASSEGKPISLPISRRRETIHA